jgi:hypothetical protein
MIDRLVVGVAFATILGACATTAPPMARSNPEERYKVEERPEGFAVTVEHSVYQFVPMQGTVADMCRSAVKVAANDVADRRGRSIEPIADDRVTVASSRNPLSGVTSCTATAVVRWRK